MSKDSATKNSGISAIGLLGVVFVILKLCHVIEWSWWWVTAPFWGGLAIYIVILAIALIVWIIKKLWNK